MSSSRRKLIIAVALVLEDDSFWQEQIQKAKEKRTHRFWTWDWVAKGKNGECNNIYALQKELEREDPMGFMSMMRMDSKTFHWLADLVRPHIQFKNSNARKARLAEVKLSVTLNYLAIGGSNASLARQYRIGRSSVEKIIPLTCAAIYKVLKDEYLTTPRDPESWLQISKEFEYRWNFPHCIGAVDGKHVRIRAPDNTGSVFHNYKHYFSVVMLAIVSANYEFLFLDVGAQGSAADGGIWRDCAFKNGLEDGTISLPPPSRLPGGDPDIVVPYVLVGDDAFPLTNHMMKPHAKRDLSTKQRIFNYRLSRVQRISENAFGIVANRFRVFLTCIQRGPDTVESMILACCALHNLLRRQCPRSYMPAGVVDTEDQNFNLQPGQWRAADSELVRIGHTPHRNPSRYAKAIQDYFTKYFAGVGAVPWQDRHIHDPSTFNFCQA